MANTAKRIQKEIMILQKEAPEGCSAGPEGDNLHDWTGIITGPKNTPYAGGKFKLKITLKEDYPFHPPEVKLLTKCYHPNVNNDDGSICLDIIKEEEWRPTCTIKDVLNAVTELLAHPNPDHALDAACGEEYIKNKAKWEKTAKEWAKKHAGAK